ncbi:thiamine-phosphate kinase [Helicobacter cappadocius]|uniref:Thiamine-monophosphate kinase n=1 Tax=Helicobacter cappadocius TaxID=3063998 RepID=A0AA90PLK5_9HELI|nr:MULTISPECIES: thiamine-phosphate kinase [unclassified Helicobacter]MDO7253482.1 thiamine-phosphate kinase [Helicobacter sp. faydin-H75]MDP2539409.1 thiamine-phosphate kinase [Helicobacter sp. faydin-H76]
MDKESYFLQKLIDTGITKGIGDDAVVFSNNPISLHKGRGLCLPNDIASPVYAMDMFWEGVHFKKEWFSAREIAQKAFLINISDILAMNAIPKYALLGVCIPKDATKDFIDDFIFGIKKVCNEFCIKIIGGDTICGREFGISISMIGQIRSKPLFRVGAKIGDLIIHTGRVGGSYAELKKLLSTGARWDKKSRFYEPILRLDFIYAIARFAHLGIDISDGINAELNRLSKINKLFFKLKNPHDKIYQSGEEYEMLFCISPKDYLHTKKIANLYRVSISCIGRVVRGKNSYRTILWH